MSMPPLICYRYKQPKWDLVNEPGDDNRRAVFYGWNNLTPHETKAIPELKVWLKTNKNMDIPPGFDDREVLKFIQASFFKIPEIGDKIAKHFLWLESLPAVPILSSRAIRML